MVTLFRSKIGQLFATPTRINAVTSYVMQILSGLFGVLSVRLAYTYLAEEQYGIWTLFSLWMGMLVLMDFGVSTGASRMLAEPIRNKDQDQIDMWWTTIVVVLTILGAVMLVAGFCAEPFLLTRDKVKPEFAAQASMLWRLMVVSNAIKLPFQAFAGVLFCQNRFYQMNLSVIVGSAVNMLAFYILLKFGWSLNAYTGALALQLAVMVGYWWFSIKVSGIRLRVRRELFLKQNVRKLFDYSGSMFVYSVAGQIPVACQAKILEVCLGLPAVAAYGASTRAWTVLAQLLQRTQEAKVPGWWQHYAGGERETIVSDRRRLMSWFMPALIFSGVGLMMYNRSFITLLTGPSLTLGRGFDATLAISMVVVQYIRSTHFIFPLTQRTWRWALISLLDAVLQVAIGYWLTKVWGATGMLLGALIAMVLTNLPFSLFAAPGLLGAKLRDFYRGAGFDAVLGALVLAGSTAAVLKAGAVAGWWPLPIEWAFLPVVFGLLGWSIVRFRRAMKRA